MVGFIFEIYLSDEKRGKSQQISQKISFNIKGVIQMPQNYTKKQQLIYTLFISTLSCFMRTATIAPNFYENLTI